jgi:hypothetical protein
MNKGRDIKRCEFINDDGQYPEFDDFFLRMRDERAITGLDDTGL